MSLTTVQKNYDTLFFCGTSFSKLTYFILCTIFKKLAYLPWNCIATLNVWKPGLVVVDSLIFISSQNRTLYENKVSKLVKKWNTCMHFITLYFILIYQIRCGLSSVKFSLVWKISFSGRFYWFLCTQSGVGMLFVTLKFRKKKTPKKTIFCRYSATQSWLEPAI